MLIFSLFFFLRTPYSAVLFVVVFKLVSHVFTQKGHTAVQSVEKPSKVHQG